MLVLQAPQVIRFLRGQPLEAPQPFLQAGVRFDDVPDDALDQGERAVGLLEGEESRLAGRLSTSQSELSSWGLLRLVKWTSSTSMTIVALRWFRT